MRLLWAIDHGLQSLSKRMQSQIGVTGPQRLTLRVLGAYPEISAGELADTLHLHRSTLTGVLYRLEKLRLVSRAVAPDDRRRAVLRLTARGRAVNRAQRGTVEDAVRSVLGRLSPRDLAATGQVLSALAGALAATGAKDLRPARRPRRRR